jgi:hypothetical protein
MSRLRPVLILLTVLLALPLAAADASAQSAADRPGPWQVSALGGWYSGTTPYVFKGDFQDKVQFGSSATFGLRLAYDFWPRWGLELSWTRATPDEKFETHVPPFIRQIRLDTFELDANIYLGQSGVRPFFTVGVGGANTGSSYGGVNLTTSVGLGVKWFVNRHIALRAEGRFRGTYGNIDQRLGPNAYCDTYGCYVYNGSWYYNSEFSGGLAYAF